jgi:hypothetical protein
MQREVAAPQQQPLETIHKAGAGAVTDPQKKDAKRRYSPGMDSAKDSPQHLGCRRTDMGKSDRYLAYAAVEEVYVSDDWSKLEPFLPRTPYTPYGAKLKPMKEGRSPDGVKRNPETQFPGFHPGYATTKVSLYTAAARS